MSCGVAYSPDGKTVLTGSFDNTARLWDATTGKPIGRPRRTTASSSRSAFSPDGRTVLTGSLDGTARLWDAATGEPIGGLLQHQSFVVFVTFSPDGRAALTCGDDNRRPALGRLDRPVAGQPPGTPRHGLRRGVPSRWEAARHRRVRLRGPGLGYRHEPLLRDIFPGGKPGVRGGLQPGRPDDRHRLRRRDGPASRRHDGPLDRGADAACVARSMRSPSTPAVRRILTGSLGQDGAALGCRHRQTRR